MASHTPRHASGYLIYARICVSRTGIAYEAKNRKKVDAICFVPILEDEIFVGVMPSVMDSDVRDQCQRDGDGERVDVGEAVSCGYCQRVTCQYIARQVRSI